jgi:hypothetical protein
MKRFTVLGLIVCLFGCTTMQPVTGNPAALQQRIASGELLKQGDDVIIRTKDGRTHVFSVESVSASTIDGQYESISIDQVALIQKRKLNVGETALAVGLGVVVLAAVVVVAVCCVRNYGGRSGGHRSAGHASRGRGPARYTQPLPPSLPQLQTPPQIPQPQTCDGPGSESKTQGECGGESAALRWPDHLGDITPSRSAIPGFAEYQPGPPWPVVRADILTFSQDVQILSLTPAHRASHGVDPKRRAAVLKHHALSAEQGRALEEITANGDLKSLVGVAGSGKSTTLAAVREAWEKEGYTVKSAALDDSEL